MKAILEKIDVSESIGIHAFVYEKKHFDMPLHVHPEFELTLILEGSGIRYVGNDVSDFEPGDMVLLGSNLPHCWKDTGNPVRSKSLVIQWRKEVLHDLPIFEQIHALLEKSQRGLHIKDQKATFSNLMQELIIKKGLKQYLLLIELLEHIAKMGDHLPIAGPSYSYDATDKTTTRLESIQSYVKDHFKEKIMLVNVANELNMSEQAFSRFFSKTMKKPFFVFLNEYRVNRASRLIFETDMQMSEIAYKCGYDSLPFFYKQFKKFKGYTPLEFRKMYKKI